MVNLKQATSKRLGMAERAQQLMDLHFPGMAAEWMWYRKKNDGYTTLPRTLPLAMQVIDAQSKGQPAGHTLFCLWTRSPDHPVITIENPATFASEAGFTGERAVDTWRRRMKTLQELGFIMAKAGPSGAFHYVLLTNPNAIVERLRLQNRVQDGLYGQFLARTADIGAFVEVEAVRKWWVAREAQQAAQQAAAAPAGSPPPTSAAPLVPSLGTNI